MVLLIILKLTSLYLVEGLAWWNWLLTCGLTNYCPSVLWHCWVIWPVKPSPIWPIMYLVGR